MLSYIMLLGGIEIKRVFMKYRDQLAEFHTWLETAEPLQVIHVVRDNKGNLPGGSHTTYGQDIVNIVFKRAYTMFTESRVEYVTPLQFILAFVDCVKDRQSDYRIHINGALSAHRYYSRKLSKS